MYLKRDDNSDNLVAYSKLIFLLEEHDCSEFAASYRLHRYDRIGDEFAWIVNDNWISNGALTLTINPFRDIRFWR